MGHPELQYEYAIPSDPDIDEFASGDDEVDRYFRSRQWFDDGSGKMSPPTYKFCDGDDFVGLASVAFRDNPHAADGSPTKAEYLVVYVVGVHEELQGAKNPNASDETYAVTLFRTLERFGREKEALSACHSGFVPTTPVPLRSTKRWVSNRIRGARYNATEERRT